MNEEQHQSNDEHEPSLDQRGLERRRFMELGVLSATSVVGLTLLGTGGRFVVGDALESKAAQWVKIGDIAGLPIDQMNKLAYSFRTKDVWRTVAEEVLLYIFGSEDGANYVVLSAVCTHLGCNVRWEEGASEFRCPCHDARFDRVGEVVSGPPRRPLKQLETKVENGVLFARM